MEQLTLEDGRMLDTLRRCLACSAPLNRTQKRYCSNKCSASGRSTGPVTRPCGHCGADVTRNPSQMVAATVFCSRECSNAGGRKRIPIACANPDCYNIKEWRPSDVRWAMKVRSEGGGTSLFCSKACSFIARRKRQISSDGTLAFCTGALCATGSSGTWKTAEAFGIVTATGYLYTYCSACRNMHRRLNKYGISFDDFRYAHWIQSGRCAVCRSPLRLEDRDGCCIDHCHENGHFRGLLCGGCNASEGLLRKSAGLAYRTPSEVALGMAHYFSYCAAMEDKIGDPTEGAPDLVVTELAA